MLSSPAFFLLPITRRQDRAILELNPLVVGEGASDEFFDHTVCASETAFAPTPVLLGSMGSWCRSLRSGATPKLRCAASIRSIECLHRSLKSCFVRSLFAKVIS